MLSIITTHHQWGANRMEEKKGINPFTFAPFIILIRVCLKSLTLHSFIIITALLTDLIIWELLCLKTLRLKYAFKRAAKHRRSQLMQWKHFRIAKSQYKEINKETTTEDGMHCYWNSTNNPACLHKHAPDIKKKTFKTVNEFLWMRWAIPDYPFAFTPHCRHTLHKH